MANILARRLIGPITLKRLPTSVIARRTATEFCKDKIGDREIVGFGWNGNPCYMDRPDYPFPSIRFKEASKEFCALREKEKCDWKKLTIDEKRCLYRYSFCQTYAEMKAPTGEWKFVVGTALWVVAIGMGLAFAFNVLGVYPDNPPTFEESRRRAQLKRMLDLEMDPVDGISSKWDYENDRWK